MSYLGFYYLWNFQTIKVHLFQFPVFLQKLKLLNSYFQKYRRFHCPDNESMFTCIPLERRAKPRTSAASDGISERSRVPPCSTGDRAFSGNETLLWLGTLIPRAINPWFWLDETLLWVSDTRLWLDVEGFGNAWTEIWLVLWAWLITEIFFVSWCEMLTFCEEVRGMSPGAGRDLPGNSCGTEGLIVVDWTELLVSDASDA